MSVEVPTVIDERCFTGEARRRYENPKNYLVNIIDKYDREFAEDVSPSWREWLAYSLECFWKCKGASLNIDRLADKYRAFISQTSDADWREILNEYFGVKQTPTPRKYEKNEVLSLLSNEAYQDWLEFEQRKQKEKEY